MPAVAVISLTVYCNDSGGCTTFLPTTSITPSLIFVFCVIVVFVLLVCVAVLLLRLLLLLLLLCCFDTIRIANTKHHSPFSCSYDDRLGVVLVAVLLLPLVLFFFLFFFFSQSTISPSPITPLLPSLHHLQQLQYLLVVGQRQLFRTLSPALSLFFCEKIASLFLFFFWFHLFLIRIAMDQ